MRGRLAGGGRAWCEGGGYGAGAPGASMAHTVLQCKAVARWRCKLHVLTQALLLHVHVYRLTAAELAATS
jgi:hypothetical protein